MQLYWGDWGERCPRACTMPCPGTGTGGGMAHPAPGTQLAVGAASRRLCGRQLAWGPGLGSLCYSRGAGDRALLSQRQQALSPGTASAAPAMGIGRAGITALAMATGSCFGPVQCHPTGTTLQRTRGDPSLALAPRPHAPQMPPPSPAYMHPQTQQSQGP